MVACKFPVMKSFQVSKLLMEEKQKVLSKQIFYPNNFTLLDTNARLCVSSDIDMLKVETLQVMSLMAHATAVNNYIWKPSRVNGER
jgi:hypothetical protein